MIKCLNQFLFVVVLIVMMIFASGCGELSSSETNVDCLAHYIAEITNYEESKKENIKKILLERINNSKIKYYGIYFLDSNRIVVQLNNCEKEYVGIFDKIGDSKFTVLASQSLKGKINFNFQKGGYYIFLKTKSKNPTKTLANRLKLTKHSYIQISYNQPDTLLHLWFSINDYQVNINDASEMKKYINNKLGESENWDIKYIAFVK